MELPSYTTPEGLMNIILASIVAASVFLGLFFAAVEYSLIPLMG